MPFSNSDHDASAPANPDALKRFLAYFGIDQIGPGTIVVLLVVLALAVWALVQYQTQQDRESDAAREYAESIG